jgi:TRAP-type mannitol/chloroaromatic compound transport system substrate-binding protein
MAESEGRKMLGHGLSYDERIGLAQLVNQPGWKILVRLMAEACRNATEEVIKLKPTAERYAEVLAGLQTTAHAMNKFSAEVLDSVKVHQRAAVQEAQQRENPSLVVADPKNRFQMPMPKSPVEGTKSNQ